MYSILSGIIIPIMWWIEKETTPEERKPITLSTEEKIVARAVGITEREYAKHKKELQELGRLPYQKPLKLLMKFGFISAIVANVAVGLWMAWGTH
jgi:hypothetical protein